jgi:hypothetical protein
MTAKEIRDENLTRWNRAGLERFRYVDGNAVTFLESIRNDLAARFPVWDDVNEGIQAEETPQERRARIVKQYGAPRREWAWEIARAFARATHILTEHANAFANEGYISTVTQWEYLRRLVAILDYHPRPPASASTTLVLIARQDKGVGTVKAGFQVKHSPEDGSPPVIFETLEDIEVDPRLNAVRLNRWDYNPRRFNPFKPYSATVLWALPKDAKVSVGQPGILLDKVGARAVTIGSVSDDRSAFALALPHDRTRKRGDTHLWLEPDKVYLPYLNGSDVLKLGDSHGLVAGQIIGWKKDSTLGLTRVVAADRQAIQVTGTVPSATDITAADVLIYATGEVSQEQFAANSNEWRFPLDSDMPKSASFRIAAIDADHTIQPTLKNAGDLQDLPAGSRLKGYKILPSVSADSLRFFDPGQDQSIARTQGKPARTQLDFDGGVGALKSGDHVVVEDSAEAKAAVRIKRIGEREDSFSLELTDVPATLQNVRRLHGPFTRDLRPAGYDRDPSTVDLARLELEFSGETLPVGLTAGKTVVVEPEDGAGVAQPFKATILDIRRQPRSQIPRLVLDATAAQVAGYTRGNLIIRANAVAAGHGESKPGTTLGSGDAAQTAQSFTFEKERVSFRADSTLSQGVRAAIQITVADRRYEEVSTFADSEAADAHYTVHMTEEGNLQIAFGDGFHGRRLPTGRNNVAISYRVGTGSAGNNLVAGSLKKAVKPHNFVAEIRQPLSTSGGQEMENVDEIRRNAPAHLRTLDRGVSLADFEHLAGNQVGVWHAKAFLNPAGAHRNEFVELAVVPVGGAELGDLKQALEQRLVNLAVPGVVFKVSRFDPVPLTLRITLRVDTEAFDYVSVEKAVRSAVYQSFKLEVRAPGRPVYRAEVYESIEAVLGVVNSDVSIFPGLADPIVSEEGDELRRVSRGMLGEIWAAWPTDRQAVYVADPAAIMIVPQGVIV